MADCIIKAPKSCEDFVGFTFNGMHCIDDLKIYRTSDGSRFQQNLTPQISEQIGQHNGIDGAYFLGAQHRQRTFDIKFAFTDLSQTDIVKLQTTFAFDKMGELWFDEYPYKVWDAKVTGTPQLQVIPFDKHGNLIYKGEGTIQFTAYCPYAHTPDYVQDKNGNLVDGRLLSAYSEFNNVQQWKEAAGLWEETPDNGIIDVRGEKDSFIETFSVTTPLYFEEEENGVLISGIREGALGKTLSISGLFCLPNEASRPIVGIKEEVFQGNGLQYININTEYPFTIYDNAFKEAKIKDFTLITKNEIPKIGGKILNGCPLEELVITLPKAINKNDEILPCLGYLFDECGDDVRQFKNKNFDTVPKTLKKVSLYGDTIPSHFMQKCVSIKQVDLSGMTINTFPDGVFQECSELEQIKLPKMPEEGIELGISLFQNAGIENFDGLKPSIIGSYSFDAQALQQVAKDEKAVYNLNFQKVTDIQECAFRKRSILTKEEQLQLNCNIGHKAFYYAKFNQDVQIQKGQIDTNAFEFAQGKNHKIVLKECILKENDKGQGLQFANSIFKEVDCINNSFAKIPTQMFHKAQIETILLPTTIHTIGESSFYSAIIDTLVFDQESSSTLMKQSFYGAKISNLILGKISLASEGTQFQNSIIDNISGKLDCEKLPSTCFAATTFKDGSLEFSEHIKEIALYFVNKSTNATGDFKFALPSNTTTMSWEITRGTSKKEIIWDSETNILNSLKQYYNWEWKRKEGA